MTALGQTKCFSNRKSSKGNCIFAGLSKVIRQKMKIKDNFRQNMCFFIDAVREMYYNKIAIGYVWDSERNGKAAERL